MSKPKPLYVPRQEYPDRNAAGASSFPELIVSVKKIETNILLLFCEEDDILTAVLTNMVQFIRAQPDNVNEMKKRNVMGVLFQKDFFMSSKSFLIRRLASYMGCAILEGFRLNDLESEFVIKLLETCVRYYLQEDDDDFIIEYLSVMINRVCTDPAVALRVLEYPDFLEKFFNTVKGNLDPDVIFNSFEAIEKILKVQNYDEMIYFATDYGFPIDRILCELTSAIEEIDMAALKIIQLLITDTGPRGVFCKPKRCIFALKQLVKLITRKDYIDFLELAAIEVLTIALLTERMVRYFFEESLFEQLVTDIQNREQKYEFDIKCKILQIFAECCKYEQYLPKMHYAHITDWLLNCLLDFDPPPANFILLGLNRFMKFNDAANSILKSFARGLMPRLLEIIHNQEFPIKVREQSAQLVLNLIDFNLHKTARALFDLLIGDVIADILNQDVKSGGSIDLALNLINIVETLSQNIEYREILASNEVLVSRMDLLLKNSFAHSILVNNLIRCLGILCEEEGARNVLLENYFPYSLNRALKSLSALVKTTATNFIMRTCRSSDFVEMFIDYGILETLIMNQKHSHCVPTWSNAIDYILAKCPSLKFQIRQHLDFLDTTKGSDFLVPRKKCDDFRTFLKILKEECSPLWPIYVVNFDRPEPDPDSVIEIPNNLLTPEEIKGSPEGWCYCRQPGDEKLPELLKIVTDKLREAGVIDQEGVKPKRCINFENISKHAKILAEVIAEAMSKDVEAMDLTTVDDSVSETVRCFTQVLTLKLHCNFIPLGLMESGGQYERAVLFKALADQTGLPATLGRSVDSRVLYNEIPLPVEMDQDIHCKPDTLKYMPWRMLRPTHIVDLIFHVGAIYPLQSRQAIQYLRLN